MLNPFKEFFAPKFMVGLEVTDSYIGAVQVFNTLKGLEIDRIAFREIENADRISQELTEFFTKEGLRHEMLISCLPMSSSIVRQIPLTFDKVKKIDKIIKYQMEPYVPYPIDKIVVDFLPSGPDDNITTIGVQKDLLAKHMSRLTGAKLEPQVVSLDDIALFHLYTSNNRGETGKVVCILHFGQDENVIQVICENRLDFMRSLPKGEENLDQLKNTLKLYQLEKPDVLISEILITGYSDVDKGMADRITEVTKTKTSVWRPFDALTNKKNQVDTALQAKLSVSLGLAVSVLDPGEKVFDLRKEEFTNRASLNLRKTFTFMFSAIFILVFLFTFNVYQKLYIDEKRHSELKLEIKQIFSSTFPKTGVIVKGQELAQMSRKIEEETGKYTWLEDLTGGGKALDILMVLTRTISGFPDVKIDNLSIEENEIRLHGHTASFETVDKLKQKLTGSGYFKIVRLVGAKMDKKKEAVIFNFALEKNR
jgi:Tfp pilus assembly PilM family ATPase